MSNDADAGLGHDVNTEVEPDDYTYQYAYDNVHTESHVDRDCEDGHYDEHVEEIDETHYQEQEEQQEEQYLEEQQEEEHAEEQQGEQQEEQYGEEQQGDEQDLQLAEYAEAHQHYLPAPTGVSAEVVLLITSFGAARKSFFSSRRAKNFLDSKAITYYMVDTNKDVAEGSGTNDIELYQAWKEKGILLVPEGREEVIVPQILIDGISIGDDVCLQDLEEDGDLDWLLARAACPKCLNEKGCESAVCGACGSQLTAIIPPEYADSRKIRKLCKGNNLFDPTEFCHYPSFRNLNDAANVQRQSSAAPNLNYEELFGEPPEEGPDIDFAEGLEAQVY